MSASAQEELEMCTKCIDEFIEEFNEVYLKECWNNPLSGPNIQEVLAKTKENVITKHSKV